MSAFVGGARRADMRHMDAQTAPEVSICMIRPVQERAAE